jgi:hypothetical protein
MSTAVFRVYPLPTQDPRVVATPSLGTMTIPNGTTLYVPVPTGLNGAGVDIQWKDAISAATITFEQTSSPPTEVADDVAGDGSTWQQNTVVTALITNPNATAIGGTKFRAKDLPCSRNRLKIVTTAICKMEIFVHPKDV